MKQIQSVLRKIRPFLWVVGAVCVVGAIWFAVKRNYAMATNLGLVAGLVVVVPELLSQNVKKSDKPMLSSEKIAQHQKRHPTATLAESINDLRDEK
ncbi:MULTISPECIES: hypothetical protein [Corynebacterium]|uniref:hypothetical protein n=1 Tax=Corynebacterium TaxID=1716 RepID=UPI0019579D5C|nr:MULTISPECIES: hypothetical protein [Corynebacterium]MDN8625188.1 hypothetical protein [Corynebacterium kroppenstedtii]QRQ64930.1 hypothetical protein I6J23_10570 [Corynebacterium kroppenstedtii]